MHTEEHGQRVLRSLKLDVGGTLDIFMVGTQYSGADSKKFEIRMKVDGSTHLNSKSPLGRIHTVAKSVEL